MKIWIVCRWLIILLFPIHANAQCPTDDVVGCIPFVKYEQTNNMPDTTKTTDYIQAGNNAVVLNGKSVTFEAGQTVLLQDGFHAQNGSTFSAMIKPCTSLAALKVTICTSPQYGACGSPNVSLTALVTGGRGSYTYKWSNNLGDQRVVKATIQTSTTFSVAVVDNITKDSSFTTFIVGTPASFLPFAVDTSKKEFRKGENYFLKSVGSDINQAYNASSTSFDIFTQNGFQVFASSSLEPTVDSNFSWNGGSYPPGIYNWTLDLKNCLYAAKYKGNVILLAPLDIDLGLRSQRDFLVSPNPISTGALQFGKKANAYTLLNCQGSIVQQGNQADQLNITGLSSGLYLLKMDDQVEKVIIGNSF